MSRPKKMMSRIEMLIDSIAKDLYEREEVVAVSLLSALAGQSIFLYGLPGTAKSLIARRLSHTFKDSTHFEYLMQRFSTPEEVFGPVSIHELKKDNYVRKTEGYLPTADFAFLDEIWKSSPAILNTLLTIINERIFRNGNSEEKVPLKVLIAASNETPPTNQGLDALYDRFVMRITVNPMEKRDNFEQLLDGKAVLADIDIPDDLKFSHDEWNELGANVSEVTISKEVFQIINAIRVELDKWNKNNPKISVYVSDRRWQKIAQVLKTAAFLCDRTEVIPVDTLLLRHSLWTLEENQKPIEDIIENCIKEFGSVDKEKQAKWVTDFNDLEQGISDTFYYSEDIYDTESIQNKEYFPITTPEISKGSRNNYYNNNNQQIKLKLYLPIGNLGTAKIFHPINESGQIEDRIKCDFKGGKTCTITYDSYVDQLGWDDERASGKYIEWFKKAPKIKIKKGAQKKVHSRTTSTFVNACQDSVSESKNMINSLKSYIRDQKKQNNTPFVPVIKGTIVLTALNTYLKDLENNKLNAEHLLEKVNSYAVSK